MEEKPQGQQAVSEGRGVSRRTFMKYVGVGAVVAAGVGVGAYAYLNRPSGVSAAPLQWWGIGTGNPERWDGLNDAGGDVVFTEAPWDPVPVLNKMKADGRNAYDVISNAGTLDDPLFADGSIVDFDPETLPSWSKIYPELRTNNPTITVASTGQIVGVPIVQNGDSVAMLVDDLWPGTGKGQGIDSYGLLFDSLTTGKSSMEQSWACAIYKVANYLGWNHLQTIQDPASLTTDDLNTIKTFMLKQKTAGQFKVFWEGWNTAVSLLANKDVLAMDTWEPVVFALRTQDPPINAVYMAPKEGYYLWNIPIYMTPKGQSQTKDRCMHLSQWTLEGWYGARITTIRGYLTATPDAIQYAQDNPDAGGTSGGPYDAAFIQSRHTLVKQKFSDGVSVYGNQAPPNIQEYQDTWTQVTS